MSSASMLYFVLISSVLFNLLCIWIRNYSRFNYIYIYVHIFICYDIIILAYMGPKNEVGVKHATRWTETDGETETEIDRETDRQKMLIMCKQEPIWPSM